MKNQNMELTGTAGVMKRVPATGHTQDCFYKADQPVPLPMVERASGIYLWDEEGRDYIDACSGPMVSAIGHGNKRVIGAMSAQAEKLDYAYTHIARNRANEEYAGALSALAGPGYERVSLVSGGSEAIEAGIRFLRQYAVGMGQESRSKVITCDPSYHGGTIATLGMAGNPSLVPFLDGFAVSSEKVPAPLGYRLPEGHDPDSYAEMCASALEEKIERLGPENVLAFMIEPVGGLASGCVVPPDRYFKRIRDICDRFGVFLVFDEVLCGMGRTGQFLAAGHWPDSMPDIIVKAKAMGAGYAPLGAVLAPAAMVDVLSQRTGCDFSFSYNANPISCAAGLAVLEEYKAGSLVEEANRKGAVIRAGIEAMMASYPFIGDVRGKGMLLAVELVQDRKEKRVFPSGALAPELVRMKGLDHGLMIFARPAAAGKHGQWFCVAPPLTITDHEIDLLLERIEKTLKDVMGALRAGGVM